MDEAVISAIASASMLSDADKLSGDLGKIEEMTARAALSSASDNESVKTEEFHLSIGIFGEENTALREDNAEKCADDGIVSQSKRYEGSYTSVPRVV